MTLLRSARPPERVTLSGRYVRLEPLDEIHIDDVYAFSAAEGAEARFAYLFVPPPASRQEVAAWVEHQLVSADPLNFAVVDGATGRCLGRQALMNIVPDHGVIELGSVIWGPGLARTRMATEAFYLTVRHVFEDLGYRRFEWKCNALNQPSRRAAERFGMTYEGTFRQHMIVKGENRDTAWFSLLDHEWPRVRAAFDAWLDPANFAPDGTQKSPLAIAA